MRFAALIYGPDTQPDNASPDEWQTIMDEYNAFGAEADAAGVIGGGEALQGVETATCVQVVDGKTLTTDGPFAETKEVLGGFYLLDCADLDEALEWAAKIPGAWHGGRVEVRPVIDFS